MVEDFNKLPEWNKLLADLSQVDAEDTEHQGEIDDVLLARYLEGKCNEAERTQIERAIEHNPAFLEDVQILKKALVIHDRPTVPTRRRVLVRRSIPNWVAAASVLIAIAVGAALLTHTQDLSQRIAHLESLVDSKKLQSPLEKNPNPVASSNHTSDTPPLDSPRNVRGKSLALLPGDYVTVMRPSFDKVTRENLNDPSKAPIDQIPTPSPTVLLKALRHPESITRWAAADVLNKTSRQESKDALENIVDALSIWDKSGHDAAEYVYSGQIPMKSAIATPKKMHKWLTHKDPLIRWAGLYKLWISSSEPSWTTLSSTPQAGQTIYPPSVKETISSPSSVSYQSVSPEILGAVIHIVEEEKDPLVCKLAVYYLGELGAAAKPALPSLIGLLNKHEDPQVRRWAAFAIGEMGSDGKAAVPDLLTILCQTPPKNRCEYNMIYPAVAYAISKLGRDSMDSDSLDRVKNALRERMKDENPNIRAWAAKTFLILDSEPEATNILNDNNTEAETAPPSYSTY